tara:strand:- start:608 stop:1339 length:732 start_codon:yes stop_codon:yes gene_type:complete
MKILVIGESCRDIFNYGFCNRLCPDAPAPVVNSLKITENPGMAMNVQVNLLAMDVNAELHTNNTWQNITKTRFIDFNRNYIFMRLDDEKAGYGRAKVKKIDFDKYDAIVVSDYNKGFLTKNDIAYISKNHTKVFLDTKKPLGKWCENCLFIKINNHEYEQSKNRLSEKIKQNLIVTLGSQGCTYRNTIYPVPKVEIKDSSGAGDTFISGLVCKYVETGDVDQAIIFANECATKAVQKRGVSTI